LYTAHREHGNRIMHEFLLGQDNILRDRLQKKSNEYAQKLESFHPYKCFYDISILVL
jgi:hypothetical protein